MSFINNLEDLVLDHFVGNATWSADSNLYVALSTTTPTKAGGNFTEPSGNGYARVSTAAADWTSSSTGALDNSAAITFPAATGSWGTVTHFGLFSASSGGSLRAADTLTTSRAIGDGDTAEFAIGALDMAFVQSI